jgi:hypothetical protein
METGNSSYQEEIQFFPLSSKVRISIPQMVPILLPSSIEDEVDCIWNEEQKKKRLFNQPMLSLLSFDEERILGRFVDYRYFIACQKNPLLKKYIDVFPLCVSGVCTALDHVLVGTRDVQLASYGGYMECVPSGSIEMRAYSHGEVDFFMQLIWELEEEAHIGGKRVKELHPLGLYYSPSTGVYDIGVRIVLDLQEYELVSEGSQEYPLLEWLSYEEWDRLVKSEAKKIVPLSKLLWLRLSLA